MKWIYSLLLFLSIASFGQSDDSAKYIHYPYQYGIHIPRLWADSVLRAKKLVKFTGLTASTDTTTYKPLSIDASGNVNKMSYWPPSLDVATVSDIISDSLAAHPTLIVDSVNYTHSGAESDTITIAELVGKTALISEVHPYTLHFATTYPPATEEVWFNNATGGLKFGTALQSGQTITIVYKYLVTTGTPVVEGITIDGGSVQTGIVNITTGGGSGATLSQVDSSVVRATGRQNAVHMSCILRPTWSGSATTWEVLGVSDLHDTAFSPGLSVSVVGGQLRLNYPTMQYVAGMQANWDDVLAKELYAIGPSSGVTFTQFSIWKNAQQSDVWLGSDLLSGSYVNASGNTYRVKCDTSTGIFTVDIGLSANNIWYGCDVVAGNYYDNFPQANIVNYRRATTTEIQFYLTDATTGNRRKGLLTTNDNFFIRVNGRKAVSADAENFGTNAAIFVDGMFITN